MTEAERKELEELRAYKRKHSGVALERTFYQVELALINANHRLDGVMSVRSFRLLADALFALKDAMIDERQ